MSQPLFILFLLQFDLLLLGLIFGIGVFEMQNSVMGFCVSVLSYLMLGCILHFTILRLKPYCALSKRLNMDHVILLLSVNLVLCWVGFQLAIFKVY